MKEIDPTLKSNAVTVLSTSSGKTFFAWRFILNENVFVLIDKILSGTIRMFYFYFCTLFSNSCCEINLRLKMGLTYAMSIVNWIFRKFLLEIIFCFSY